MAPFGWSCWATGWSCTWCTVSPKAFGAMLGPILASPVSLVPLPWEPSCFTWMWDSSTCRGIRLSPLLAWLGPQLVSTYTVFLKEMSAGCVWRLGPSEWVSAHISHGDRWARILLTGVPKVPGGQLSPCLGWRHCRGFGWWAWEPPRCTISCHSPGCLTSTLDPHLSRRNHKSLLGTTTIFCWLLSTPAMKPITNHHKKQ